MQGALVYVQKKKSEEILIAGAFVIMFETDMASECSL